MQNSNPVVKETSYCLAHLPDLVRHGSKPRREIAKDAGVERQISNALRSFEDAVGYPPNQVYLGELSPRQLTKIQQPWFDSGKSALSPSPVGLFGEIIPQDMFYALIKQADVLHPPLFELTRFGSELLRTAAAKHLTVGDHAATEFRGATDSEIEQALVNEPAIRIVSGDKLVGCFRPDMRAEGCEDENLSAPHLLEALCTKASAALALHALLKRSGIAADQIDFVISCGEEACGDRYQRGGGGMAKSIGEMCGCVNASGMDIKNFCAAPASALVTAGALVQTGLYDRIAVVAGGSLAKLGMKYQGFVRAGIPILDDCIASAAFLMTRDDGQSPIFHLERGSIGLASIGSSTSDEAVYRDLILKPLRALGLNMNDIDRYAPELHNPEIMQFAGSGDVTKKNFRMIAAMAVMSGLMEKAEMPGFIERIGMPGFAPTQGHIPSAVPFLGHAAEAMKTGEIRRAMFLCKASLFLNRITDLFDGVSFVLEKNPHST
jgi:betaine reductase